MPYDSFAAYRAANYLDSSCLLHARRLKALSAQSVVIASISERKAP